MTLSGEKSCLHPVEGGGHGQYFGADGGRGLYADQEAESMVKTFFAAHLVASPLLVFK